MTKILLIEDSNIMRAIIKNILESEGYMCMVASNGRDGIEIFKKEAPDFVITDLNMPIMDGFEVIEKIRTINPKAKILICSALAEEKQRAVKMGVFGFIEKPFKKEQIISAIG